MMQSMSARKGGNTRARRLRALNKGLAYTALITVTFLFMVPLLWLFSSSLKTEGQYRAYPIVIFPHPLEWRNYVDAVVRYPFLKHARNSLYLSGTSMVLTVLSSALGGFGFARRQARLRNAFFILVLSMLMVPQVVTIIPTFVLFARLRLTNTYWPWILWGLGGSPYHIFLFRQFFAAIPRELEDAAEVDGCGHFRVFWQIFLPNSGPVLATVSVFQFQWVWGDWFTPQILLSDDLTTLSVKLATAYVTPKGFPIVTDTLAAIFIFMLPIVVLFFVAQKHIIRGVITSGLKG